MKKYQTAHYKKATIPETLAENSAIQRTKKKTCIKTKITITH